MQEALGGLVWNEGGESRRAGWRSEAGWPPPQRVVVADDTMTADEAFRLASSGTALLWRGDFQNARQLLNAMARRIDRRGGRSGRSKADDLPLTEAFHRYRMSQAQRARTLGLLLIPFAADHAVELKRAPDARDACAAVYGPGDVPYVASLRELLGLIGAHEWRKKGVEIAALGGRIHPHYGVFSPVRGEYLALVARAPLPEALSADSRAFDIGTGTGVIAALLARRGVERVVATDLDARALACARDNLTRLGLDDRVEVTVADLFPAGHAPLIVCNPPWLPGRPASRLEGAVYDPESRMLGGFLAGVAAHLAPGGEAWLILSDLAEHLGLRSRGTLTDMIAAGGLEVVEKLDTRPLHPRAADASDPLYAARAAETTSLWRLKVRE